MINILEPDPENDPEEEASKMFDREYDIKHTDECITAFYQDGGQSGCICGADAPEPVITEAQILAAKARAEYNAMSKEEQQKIKEDWDSLPEWKKQDLRDEIELDML